MFYEFGCWFLCYCIVSYIGLLMVLGCLVVVIGFSLGLMLRLACLWY